MPLTCGYFNLPKAATGTDIALWVDYTPELAAAAWRCAGGVAAAVVRREFWPPRELAGREAEFDAFAGLFQRGAAASVEAEAFR
jgi:ATP-dependent helicase/nuclease subunit B